MKLKMMPSLREKKRYLKIKIFSTEKISYSDLESLIWNTFLEIYGEEGVSKLSLWIIKNLWREDEQTVVLRCSNKGVSKVIFGLGLMQRLGDARINVKILNVSGSIKKLKKQKF